MWHLNVVVKMVVFIDMIVVLFRLSIGSTGGALGSPLIDGIFLVQKMCIYSCVTLSTTLLIRAVQFNARSACDASMFTSLSSIIYIWRSGSYTFVSQRSVVKNMAADELSMT